MFSLLGSVCSPAAHDKRSTPRVPHLVVCTGKSWKPRGSAWGLITWVVGLGKGHHHPQGGGGGGRWGAAHFPPFSRPCPLAASLVHSHLCVGQESCALRWEGGAGRPPHRVPIIWMQESPSPKCSIRGKLAPGRAWVPLPPHPAPTTERLDSGPYVLVTFGNSCNQGEFMPSHNPHLWSGPPPQLPFALELELWKGGKAPVNWPVFCNSPPPHPSQESVCRWGGYQRPLWSMSR